MRDQIEQVLNQVRPALRMDGGDIQLVDFDEATGIVRVRLEGACRGCPMSKITLKMGVEMALMDAFPDNVKEVVSVDDEDGMEAV
ncbi:NifU family protein [bacterium]|nr:NifU family protein [bacterium]